MGPRKDLAALAGVISPVVFGLGVVLTVAQYDFMTGLGWRPVGDSSGVPWPSGLALGPCGWLQVLNFVLFGVLLIFFALGLHRGVVGGSKIGPALLAVAGFAMVLAAFETDPDISDGPQSWHGMIHGISYILFIFSSPLSFFFVWWRLRKDPLWRGHDLYTLLTGVLLAILFFVPDSLAFFLFLFLAWIEVMALRLRSTTRNVAVERIAPAT